MPPDLCETCHLFSDHLPTGKLRRGEKWSSSLICSHSQDTVVYCSVFPHSSCSDRACLSARKGDFIHKFSHCSSGGCQNDHCTFTESTSVESTEGEHLSFLHDALKTRFFIFTGRETDIGGGWENISTTSLVSLNALNSCFGNPHHQQLSASLTEAATSTNTLLSGLPWWE